MTSTPVSTEAFLGGAIVFGLLIMLGMYVISTLFQALFIKLGLKWVSRLGVGFGSAFVTALCINVVGLIVSLVIGVAVRNEYAIGQTGILLNLLVGTVLISKRHNVKMLEGFLVELISIALSLLMGVAFMVMIGLVIFLVAMGMQSM